MLNRNADLKEYIASGVSREEFMRRLFKALSPSEPAALQPEAEAATTPTSASTSVAAPVSAPLAAPIPAPVSAPAAARVSPPIRPSLAEPEESAASSSGRATPSPTSDARAEAQAMLAERAARLAERKKQADEEAKRKREEKAKARVEPSSDGKSAPQQKYVESLKQKQKAAREERQRILKAIEDDKAARKAKQAELAAERKALAEASTAPFAPASELLPRTGKLTKHASIQIRLFDGSTLRSRFLSTDTLEDVRQFVDENRKDGKQPYTFKVLLTPLPSKRIDVTEEGKTLQALELAPSATLILVHIPKHTTAYNSTSSAPSSAVPPPEGNIFQRFIAFILAIINGLFGNIALFFTSMFSGGEAPNRTHPDTQQQADGRAQATGRAEGRRVAGLDNIRRRNEQQFYNGNSVSLFSDSFCTFRSHQLTCEPQTNFQPRPDDGDEE